MEWCKDSINQNLKVSDDIEFSNNFDLFYLHTAEIHSSDILNYKKFSLMLTCEPVNYTNLRKVKNLKSYNDPENLLEVLKLRFSTKYEEEYKPKIIEKLKELNFTDKNTVVTFVPNIDSYFEWPYANDIFVKEKIYFGHGDTTNYLAWNSIHTKKEISLDANINKVIILDDCYASGRTFNICIQKIKNLLHKDVEFVCLSLLKLPDSKLMTY
jgi:hypothetical protein